MNQHLDIETAERPTCESNRHFRLPTTLKMALQIGQEEKVVIPLLPEPKGRFITVTTKNLTMALILGPVNLRRVVRISESLKGIDKSFHFADLTQGHQLEVKSF